MIQHVLTGLDGGNPLGFLAAIGLLRVLDDRAEKHGAQVPRLGFPDSSTPLLITELDFEAIVATVLDDARVQGDNRALQLAYTAEGELTVPGASDAIRDLKPRPRAAAAFLKSCMDRSCRESGLAAAWFSENAQDKAKGNTKPTAFHFMAGQQAFLDMVDKLRQGITAADIGEALIGPWRNTSSLPSLSWDSSVTRAYALRASNPSGEKRGSVPGANWLAVIALEAFPVVDDGGILNTTAVKGGWKSAMFRWPIWSGLSSFRAICSLLRVDAESWSARERNALGISQVFGARILRSDQGGYGSFAPSELVMPR